MAEGIQDVLVGEGLLSAEDYTLAVENSQKDQISLLYAIENLQKIPEKKLLETASKFYKMNFVELDKLEVSEDILKLIPKDLVQRYRIIPVEKTATNIVVAIGDRRNVMQVIDNVRFKTGLAASFVLASETKITEAMEKYYARMDLTSFKGTPGSALEAAAKRASSANARISINTGNAAADKEDGPIIRLVNDVILQCISRGASDIHMEPYEEYVRIRLRIDGSLHEIARPPTSMKSPLISRIKIMAGLNIAESRLPQDGAINISVGDKAIDFRVSSLPTLHGEKIVMRILDKSALQVDMTQLGFESDELKGFKRTIHNPHGIVLVTGPTGSGKTTTLYSALQELNQEDTNIMTAEDPVEYNLSGVNQVQMKPEIGLNFAAALRAFLRQDPDVIMVGEVRDLETAEIAIKAALTGHLVLSTLHTNSAPDTISRLLNMGVAAFNLVAAINCITAQRLVKKICVRCREIDTSVTPEVMIDLGIREDFAQRVKAYRGAGCAACGRTGNKGRIAVHEVLILNDAVRRSILNAESSTELKRVAISSGMRTLRQSALVKMLQGVTSAQEVVKVTSSDKNRDRTIN